MTLQEEKDTLLRLVTKLALKMISEGGFVPFGVVFGPGRAVKLLMPKGWKENATRNELESYWARELRGAIASGECRTVCSCADVRIPLQNGAMAPCILVHVEQPSIAEDIGYPYMKDGDSEVRLGSPTAVETQPQIFTGRDL